MSKKTPAKALAMKEGKLCSSCGSGVPRVGKRTCQHCADWHKTDRINNLQKHKDRASSYRTRNREKVNRQQTDWLNRHPEKKIAKRRARTLKSYGMTISCYEKLVKSQYGTCAICGTIPKQLVVDHCHDRGHVRGLLCTNCNAGIGLLGDSRNRLLAAAKYLERGMLKVLQGGNGGQAA